MKNHYDMREEESQSSLVQEEQENLHLTQLRDTLLPKLMSGEINIEDYGQR